MMNLLNHLQEQLGSPSTKYLRWYISLIETRKTRVKNRGDYLEKHHVLPKAIFGSTNQVVYLTFREHYLAHLFLALHAKKSHSNINLSKLTTPLWRMRGIKKNQYCDVSCKPFSRIYDLSRKLYIESVRGKLKSEETKTRIREGKLLNPMSKELREKLSNSMKGNKNPMFGKKHTDEFKLMMSEKFKGTTRSEEFKQNLSASRIGEKHPMYGKYHSFESKQKMAESHKGITHTDETKLKMKDSWTDERKNQQSIKISQVATGRKRFILDDGSFTWKYFDEESRSWFINTKAGRYYLPAIT